MEKVCFSKSRVPNSNATRSQAGPLGTGDWFDVSEALGSAADCGGLPHWLSGKESACPCRTHCFKLWVGKIPCRRKEQPTPLFLPRGFHAWRSLGGCSPRWCKESDMNELLTHTYTCMCAHTRHLCKMPVTSTYNAIHSVCIVSEQCLCIVSICNIYIKRLYVKSIYNMHIQCVYT